MTLHSPAAAPELVSLDDALVLVLDGVAPLPPERVAVDAALGRVLAEPLASRLTLPPWDNSAMDGFAVRSTDVAAAGAGRQVTLRVVGEAAAGHLAETDVVAGTAVRILTGAPLPTGADAVVPVEDTDSPPGMADLPATVTVAVAAPPGAHVRRRGSDIHADDPLLPAGAGLGAAQLAVVAAGGHGDVAVHRQPRVAVLATGDELVPAGHEPGAAQIPDSNSVGLLAQARETGAEARYLGIARDSLDDVSELLAEAVAWADVVVVSGGVSVGAHDVVKEAFARIGRLELWRVAVQPGKPLALARARRPGSHVEVLLFGLPGNPVSSFVTFELFVRPVIRRMLGHADLSGRQTVRAALAEAVTKSPGRRAFLRVRLEPAATAGGGWLARLAGGQGSHVLSALAAADGLAVVPEEVDGLPVGADVTVVRLPAGGTH